MEDGRESTYLHTLSWRSCCCTRVRLEETPRMMLLLAIREGTGVNKQQERCFLLLSSSRQCCPELLAALKYIQDQLQQKESNIQKGKILQCHNRKRLRLGETDKVLCIQYIIQKEVSTENERFHVKQIELHFVTFPTHTKIVQQSRGDHCTYMCCMKQTKNNRWVKNTIVWWLMQINAELHLQNG